MKIKKLPLASRYPHCTIFSDGRKINSAGFYSIPAHVRPPPRIPPNVKSRTALDLHVWSKIASSIVKPFYVSKMSNVISWTNFKKTNKSVGVNFDIRNGNHILKSTDEQKISNSSISSEVQQRTNSMPKRSSMNELKQ